MHESTSARPHYTLAPHSSALQPYEFFGRPSPRAAWLSLAAQGLAATMCAHEGDPAPTFAEFLAMCPQDAPEAVRAALDELLAGGYVTEEAGK